MRLATAGRLQLLLWVAFFALMLPGGFHRYYIASWQLPIIQGGALILGLVFVIDLVGALRGRRDAPEPGTTFTRSMESLAHALPLFIFVSVGVTELSGSPLSGGGSARTAQALSRVEGGMAITGPADGGPGYQQVNLLQIFTASEHSESARVEVEGRLYKTEGQEVGWLDPSLQQQPVEALLYRYVISCCVADALPMSVVLEEAQLGQLEQQGWVRVRGRLGPFGDGSMLSIKVDEIEAIKTPREPYLTIFDRVFGPGGAAGPAHSSAAGGMGTEEEPDLTLDPDNPCNDPLQDYPWPTGE
ncbi:hypothetical protein IT575_07800 [bacterium]|nr:hypothetical protein [bacterium]